MPPSLRLVEESALLEPAPSARESIRVVLADDHGGVRRSIRLLLDGEDDIEVVAEAGDMEGVARELGTHRPHVLVLDMGIADTDGVRTGAFAEIVRLRTRAPNTAIVAVTMYDSPPFAQGALEAGAVGFVLKELADSDLPRAIRAAAVGREYVTPRLGERLEALRRGSRGVQGAEPEKSGHGSDLDGRGASSGRGHPKNREPDSGRGGPQGVSSSTHPSVSPWMASVAMRGRREG
ncbi:MAG TPA: response regulator transcription factor [Solirubrobacteraceae bacterium]|nr:response regulator transcription factor [Solirubrobacteraceae bacterium]